MAVTALASSPAWAEEGGLPQLDVSLYAEQLFWLVVSFAILYVLMWKLALPGVERAQDNRKQVIAAELAAARAANEAAKASAEKVEKSLSEARAGAQVKVSTLIADVAEQAAAQQAAQEKDITRKLHAAEADIAVTREAALRAVQGQAEELASAVVAQVIEAKLRDAA
ncbi:MAG: hypothetical protein P4M15_14205 [Alphaproteobacteria bacterium]|nr:hypothetical protein [Alphaproteobacteria bacterium]